MMIKILFHDDDCGAHLGEGGKCPKCKFVPDMQSIGILTIRTPEQLFDEALKGVESASIREWAQKQRDVWVKYCAKPIFDDERGDKTVRLTIRILAEAMGL